jgi:hypothetical protein
MLAGLFLAAGLVCSTLFAASAWVKVKNRQVISVKGSARKNVDSDLVIWTGSFAAEATSLLEAQRKLKADSGRVSEFLTSHQVTNGEFSSIAIVELKASQRDAIGANQGSTVGYRLTQSVTVESAGIGHIIELDRESTVLVEEGVLFTSEAPQFLYTKAAEAKIEMLAEATKDARDRAEQISAQGGRSIARLYSAEMGVFQITPLRATQTSWEGMNDTTSRQKTITAVVTASFEME